MWSPRSSVFGIGPWYCSENLIKPVVVIPRSRLNGGWGKYVIQSTILYIIDHVSITQSAEPSLVLEMENENPEIIMAPLTQLQPKCSAHILARASECTCGVRVTAEEIRAQTDVIRCKKPGCKTEWVSEVCLRDDYPLILPWQYHLNCVRLEIVVTGWTCDSCKPNTWVYKHKKIRKHAE